MSQPTQPPASTAPRPQRIYGWIIGQGLKVRGYYEGDKGLPDGEKWYTDEYNRKWSQYDVEFRPDPTCEFAPPPCPNHCGHEAKHLNERGVCEKMIAKDLGTGIFHDSCGHVCPSPEAGGGETPWADPECPTLAEAEASLRAQGIDPAQIPNQFIEFLGKRHMELAQFARALCEKLRAVHADDRYRGVWASAQLHIGRPYTGPTYTEELKALEDCLERKH